MGDLIVVLSVHVCFNVCVSVAQLLGWLLKTEICYTLFLDAVIHYSSCLLESRPFSATNKS